MKNFILSIISVLFLLPLSSFACSTAIDGPSDLCGSNIPTTQEYSVDFKGAWLCGNIGNVFVEGGLIVSAVDNGGFDLMAFMSPQDDVPFIGVSFPITVTVEWTEFGCNSIAAAISEASGILWCGCDSGAEVPVQISGPANVTISPSGGTTLTSCSTNQFCVDSDFDTCSESYTWNINGKIIETTDPCVDYYVGPEDCPVSASVTMNTICGSASASQSYTCDGGGDTGLDYDYSVCIGNIWTLHVPGYIQNLVIHSSAGNNVSQLGNTISFIATQQGTVVLTISYDVCGRDFTRTIFVTVMKCWGIDDKEDELSSRELELDDAKKNLDIVVFPNPTSSEIALKGLSGKCNMEIYDMTGKKVMPITSVEDNTILNVSHFPEGQYILRIQTPDEIISKKFIKN